jgi:hypothetical protein
MNLIAAGVPEKVGRLGIFIVILMAFMTLIPMAWRWT